MLELDASGNVSGGYYFRDSSQIDLLWVARFPAPGGQEGNKQGNPHLDVNEVISLWRQSVDQELVEKWVNVEPVAPDRTIIAQTPPAAESVVRADSDATAPRDNATATPLSLPNLTGLDGTSATVGANGP